MVTYYLRLFCKYDSCYFKILLISETKWFLLNMYMYSNVWIFDIKVVSSRAYCVSNGRTIATTLSWMSHSYSRKRYCQLIRECRMYRTFVRWSLHLMYIFIAHSNFLFGYSVLPLSAWRIWKSLKVSQLISGFKSRLKIHV